MVAVTIGIMTTWGAGNPLDARSSFLKLEAKNASTGRTQAVFSGSSLVLLISFLYVLDKAKLATFSGAGQENDRQIRATLKRIVTIPAAHWT
jgi:hypothetical protein